MINEIYSCEYDVTSGPCCYAVMFPLLGHRPPKRSAAEFTGDLGMESESANRHSFRSAHIPSKRRAKVLNLIFQKGQTPLHCN